jgi:hypothetical protein
VCGLIVGCELGRYWTATRVATLHSTSAPHPTEAVQIGEYGEIRDRNLRLVNHCDNPM